MVGRRKIRWKCNEKLNESVERRRNEGSSLQADVMQKVPEWCMNECPKVKK